MRLTDLCTRFMKQNKPQDAIALLHSGAVTLLKHGQVGSAVDLGKRMLDVFDSEKLPLSDTTKGVYLTLCVFLFLF